MFKTSAAAALAACLLATSLAASPGQGPRVFMTDPANYAAAKAAYEAKDAEIGKVVKSIVKSANKLLTAKSRSVMDKPFIPPTGDKHDYMSLSMYWWADPSKPDGKPYIRHDGKANPERAQYDVDAFDFMGQSAETLARAYYFTGEEKYAAKAAEFIRVWCLDPATRMNPNCQFAGFVPGNSEMRASGVLEANRARSFIEADGLLENSKSWTAADTKALKAWFAQLLDYELTSEQGIKESKSENNHGTWYGVQVATYALYVDKPDDAKKYLEKFVRDRIDSQIESDGSQPREMARTKSFEYTRFNLFAHFDGAMLGQRVGLDLWNYKSARGRSLRSALDWFTPYVSGEKKWEGQQITGIKSADAALILRRAANAYGSDVYERAAEKMLATIKEDEDAQEFKFTVMFPKKSSK